MFGVPAVSFQGCNHAIRWHPIPISQATPTAVSADQTGAVVSLFLDGENGNKGGHAEMPHVQKLVTERK